MADMEPLGIDPHSGKLQVLFSESQILSLGHGYETLLYQKCLKYRKIPSGEIPSEA